MKLPLLIFVFLPLSGLLAYTPTSSRVANNGCLAELAKEKLFAIRKFENSPPEAIYPPRAKLNVEAMEKKFHGMASQNSQRMTVTKYGQANGYDLIRIDLPSSNPAARRVVITAGIHGNEYLAPLSTIGLIERALQDKAFLEKFSVTIYPMVNPRALAQGKRRADHNPNLDLNRQATPDSTEAELVALIADLQGKQFDLGLDLHGAPLKNRMFTIGAGQDLSLARAALSRLPQNLFHESASGRYPEKTGTPSYPHRYEIEAPGVARSSLPNTLKDYLYHGVNIPEVYVLEYGGKIDPHEALPMNIDLIEAFFSALHERP